MSLLIEKASSIAMKAHVGHVDKAVALLHDVVKDTDITFDDLRAEGILESVKDPLKLLTHGEEPYFEYVEALKDNKVARKVKIQDLLHNSDLTRLSSPTKRILLELKNTKELLKC